MFTVNFYLWVFIANKFCLFASHSPHFYFSAIAAIFLSKFPAIEIWPVFSCLLIDWHTIVFVSNPLSIYWFHFNIGWLMFSINLWIVIWQFRTLRIFLWFFRACRPWIWEYSLTCLFIGLELSFYFPLLLFFCVDWLDRNFPILILHFLPPAI